MRADLFSVKEIKDAVDREKGNIAYAAKRLTREGRGKVTAQLLRMWISRMDSTDFAHGYDRAQNLMKTRNAQTSANVLRKDNRALAEALLTQQQFIDAVTAVCADMPERPPVDYKSYIGVQAGTPMTVELLLSDLQIGKLSPGYNTLVARKRLFAYGRAALFQIEQKLAAGYRIERIVLALLGDIIESDKKHKNSARATDTGTSTQIQDAIQGLYEFVIEPLARLGIPMDVVGIAGNHDWDDHGMAMFKPGKEMLSWPIYNCLALVTKTAGYFNVNFTIPEGSYAVLDFYGQHVLYEHGVGVSVSESSMKSHKVKRAEQEKKHLTYYRMGDKHTVTFFNSGQLIVNGAFFGAGPGGQEYSGIAGYSSVPAQVMCFHVQREDNRMTMYDSFVIQLDHINE